MENIGNIGNVYTDYLIFSVIMTTIVSIFYIYLLHINTDARYLDRVVKIFIAMSVLFVLLKRLNYSLELMFQIFATIFIVLYTGIFIKSIVDYFRNSRASKRGKALKIFGLLLGLLLIFAFKDSLFPEIQNLFHLSKHQ